MARRNGPVKRVRNVRNQDLAAVPLPYPVNWVLGFQTLAGTTARFLLRRASNWSTVNFDELPSSLVVPGLTVIAGTPEIVAAEWEDDAGAILAVTFGDPIGATNGFSIGEWDQSFRGPQGEWIAPFVFEYL